MSDETTVGRRTVLRGLAVGVAGPALAGCSGGDGGGDGGDGGGDGGGGGSAQSFGGWFDDTDNYDGVTDKTGSDAVSVRVGASGNVGNLAYAPAAIRVSSGTTVTWEWTGKGGAHNVVGDDGTFDSGEAIDSAEETFEYTFESAGTYKYACVPHKSAGMVGVVVVK
jgi:halocyanin-like protein